MNNTAKFTGQASRRGVLVAVAFTTFTAVVGAGCRRSKKPATAPAKPAADLGPTRPPPPPAIVLPPPSAIQAPTRAAGTLRVHLESEPVNLIPLSDNDAAAAQVTSGLIYQTLIDCSDGSYRPGLAESWDVSDDGMRLAVRVRSGVRWHDRRAFGVLDVQATIEPLLRSGSEQSTLRAALADVAAIELVTERTVRLVLKRPSDLVLRALCDVPILPDHLIRGVRLEASPVARQPVGTGPFRFVGWDRGKRIKLERFADGWGPPPGVDEIVFDVDADAVRALNRTRRGEVDLHTRVLDVHYPEQVEPTTLHGATKLIRLESGRFSFLIVNHRHEPLSDAKFRQAIAGLWDRKRFSAELHHDLARPIGGPPLDGDVPAIAHDRARVIAVLEQAGYRDSDADGVRDRQGKAIRLTMLEPAGNKVFNVEARAFALELRKAGILLDLVPADGPTILTRLRRGDFDLAPMMWQGAPDEDPSPLYGSAGAFNYGGYRSPALDALLDEARVAAGPSGRAGITRRIARLLTDDQPVIYLYRYDVPALVAGRVRGLAAVGDHFDLRRVWLE